MSLKIKLIVVMKDQRKNVGRVVCMVEMYEIKVNERSKN